MPNLRPTELIIILLIIVLLFGAKKLPELAKSIGQSMKIFRAETKTDDPATQQTVNTVSDAPAPAPAAAPAAGATTVEAPMPGKILNIKVSAGQAVKFGETVIVMEAMKMETEIVAPADGTVSKILVKAGDSVDTGAALVALN